MKRLLITTALASLVAVGTASANYSTDVAADQLYGANIESSASSVKIGDLPATAAGRSSGVQQDQHFGGMQDNPNERVSGI